MEAGASPGHVEGWSAAPGPGRRQLPPWAEMADGGAAAVSAPAPAPEPCLRSTLAVTGSLEGSSRPEGKEPGGLPCSSGSGVGLGAVGSARTSLPLEAAGVSLAWDLPEVLSWGLQA